MIAIRRSNERGGANHGWLDTKHTFSFAQYYDEKQMGFRNLRVINEDRVAPGAGFGTHSHRDMEILSYVLDGALEHRDSTGGGSVIRPGDVQRMSAGSGVAHSEFNASKTEPVHFLQVWLLPDEQGVAPSYEQKTFVLEVMGEALPVVATPDGRGGSVKIHSDTVVYAGRLAAGAMVAVPIAEGRHAWVHVAQGEVRVNGERLSAGDGAAMSAERSVAIEGVKASEVLVFDLA